MEWYNDKWHELTQANLGSPDPRNARVQRLELCVGVTDPAITGLIWNTLTAKLQHYNARWLLQWQFLEFLTNKRGWVEELNLRASQALLPVLYRSDLVIWLEALGQVLVPALLQVGQEALEALLAEQDPGVARHNGGLNGELDTDLGDIYLITISIIILVFYLVFNDSTLDWPRSPLAPLKCRSNRPLQTGSETLLIIRFWKIDWSVNKHRSRVCSCISSLRLLYTRTRDRGL